MTTPDLLHINVTTHSMLSRNHFFSSRFPIMCAVMNKVSDLPLALACADAGIMPSLLPAGQSDKDYLDVVEQQLLEFQKCTGHCNIVLACRPRELVDRRWLMLIHGFNVSHIELLPPMEYSEPTARLEFPACLAQVKQTTKILHRIFDAALPINSYADAYCVKGSESAGYTSDHSVLDTFNTLRQQQPHLDLIPYGGIGTAQQIQYYVSHGASGVAIGTLFALSTESCLSEQTKHTLCDKSSKDIVRLDGRPQNAVIFNEHTVDQDRSSWNRCDSLATGIATGTDGHIYMGQAIDQVKEIKPIKQIVAELVEHIQLDYQ